MALLDEMIGKLKKLPKVGATEYVVGMNNIGHLLVLTRVDEKNKSLDWMVFCGAALMQPVTGNRRTGVDLPCLCAVALRTNNARSVECKPRGQFDKPELCIQRITLLEIERKHERSGLRVGMGGGVVHASICKSDGQRRLTRN